MSWRNLERPSRGPRVLVAIRPLLSESLSEIRCPSHCPSAVRQVVPTMGGEDFAYLAEQAPAAPFLDPSLSPSLASFRPPFQPRRLPGPVCTPSLPSLNLPLRPSD